MSRPPKSRLWRPQAQPMSEKSAVRRLFALRGPYAAVALLQDLARGAEFAAAFQQQFAMRYEDFQATVARD